MTLQTMTVEGGDCLIAPPKLQDPRFDHAVIMITHKQGRVPFGLVLNRPSPHTAEDLDQELGFELPADIPLYWGGPVNPTTVWMLHDSGWACEESHPINDSWSITSSVEMFRRIAQGDRPQSYRICYGYCAWAPGQLEAELEGREPYTENSAWLVWRQPDERILEIADPEMWQVATEQSAHQAVNSWL